MEGRASRPSSRAETPGSPHTDWGHSLPDRQCLPGPLFDGYAQFPQSAFEEMVARFDADQFLRVGEGLDKGLELSGRTKLIARSADEEFGLSTGAQEFEIIDAAFNLDHGQAECDEGSHAVVGIGGAQSDSGAKRESGKDDGQSEFMLEPVESGADVLDFADAVRVLTFAQSGTAKIEAQHGESEAVQRFHGVEDDLVVQRPAMERVRMTHNGCMRRVWRSPVQQRFQSPNRAI